MVWTKTLYIITVYLLSHGLTLPTISLKLQNAPPGIGLGTVLGNRDHDLHKYYVIIQRRVGQANVENVGLMEQFTCNNFSKYFINCTEGAAIFYNSLSKTPPLPRRIGGWCNSTRHMYKCATLWNDKCGDSGLYFIRESVWGKRFVIDNICDNHWFIENYDTLSNRCIEFAAFVWETCYPTFSLVIKDSEIQYGVTHYNSHFRMCCAQASFKTCVVKHLFSDNNDDCSIDEALALNFYGDIISEGDVYQECDMNIPYEDCPNGNPIMDKENWPLKYKTAMKPKIHFDNILRSIPLDFDAAKIDSSKPRLIFICIAFLYFLLI